jgi:ribosomal protein S18 acetylase RimI-like enzyme
LHGEAQVFYCLFAEKQSENWNRLARFPSPVQLATMPFQEYESHVAPAYMNDERSTSHQEAGNVRLRPEESGDEALLFELYASTRQEELAMTGWDNATRSAFLNLQFKAMRRGYRTMFPQGEFSIILVNGAPVGRVVVDRSATEIHVVDIVVAYAHRNRGIGTHLMNALLEEARQAGKPVRLQVLKNSRPIGFYQRLGFSKTSETGLYEQMVWTGGK